MVWGSIQLATKFYYHALLILGARDERSKLTGLGILVSWFVTFRLAKSERINNEYILILVEFELKYFYGLWADLFGIGPNFSHLLLLVFDSAVVS